MFLLFSYPRGSERLHQVNGGPPLPHAHQSPAPARVSSLVQAALMSRPIPAISAENRLAECRLRVQGHEGTDPATFAPPVKTEVAAARAAKRTMLSETACVPMQSVIR